MAITLSIMNGFSKFFHCCKEKKISKNLSRTDKVIAMSLVYYFFWGHRVVIIITVIILINNNNTCKTA